MHAHHTECEQWSARVRALINATPITGLSSSHSTSSFSSSVGPERPAHAVSRSQSVPASASACVNAAVSNRRQQDFSLIIMFGDLDRRSSSRAIRDSEHNSIFVKKHAVIFKSPTRRTRTKRTQTHRRCESPRSPFLFSFGSIDPAPRRAFSPFVYLDPSSHSDQEERVEFIYPTPEMERLDAEIKSMHQQLRALFIQGRMAEFTKQVECVFDEKCAQRKELST